MKCEHSHLLLQRVDLLLQLRDRGSQPLALLLLGDLGLALLVVVDAEQAGVLLGRRGAVITE